MAKETKKIEDLSDEEIQMEISELAKTQFTYRFQRAMGQFDVPSKIREARKRVARLKTAQRARELRAKAGAASVGDAERG